MLTLLFVEELSVSAAAAVIVVFLALRALAHQADPFAELFAPMMGMIQ